MPTDSAAEHGFHGGTTCPLCDFHWDEVFELAEHIARFCPKRENYVPKSGMVLDLESTSGTGLSRPEGPQSD